MVMHLRKGISDTATIRAQVCNRTIARLQSGIKKPQNKETYIRNSDWACFITMGTVFHKTIPNLLHGYAKLLNKVAQMRNIIWDNYMQMASVYRKTMNNLFSGLKKLQIKVYLKLCIT